MNRTNEAIKAGFCLAGELGNDWDKMRDVMTIEGLNRRARNAWVNLNNNGGRWTPEERAKSDRRQDRCWERAQVIAKARGWKLSAPGLYWELMQVNENLLAGL